MYRINGSATLDPSTNTIRDDSGFIRKVEPLLCQVMVHLIENSGQPVRHEDLIERFWGPTVKGHEALMKTISKIRKLFPAEVISTVSKMGYQWTATVDIRHARTGILAFMPRWSLPTAIFIGLLLMILKAIIFPHAH